MERINKLLNTEITLGDCIHGEEFTNYFDMGQTHMEIIVGELKLTEKEISAVARSIKASFFYPDKEEIKEYELEEGSFSSGIDIDQDKLRKNLRKLYKKERLSHLLETKFGLVVHDDNFFTTNWFRVGGMNMIIVTDKKIDLTKEEMDAVSRSFKTSDKEGKGYTLTIDEGKLKRNLMSLYS